MEQKKKFYVSEDFPPEVNRLLEGRIQEIPPLPGSDSSMAMYEIDLDGLTQEEGKSVARAFMKKSEESFDRRISPELYYDSSRFNPDVAVAWRILLNQVQPLPRGAVVLNFSCGPGTHMDKLVERFPEIGSILCCDVSDGQLKVARDKLPTKVNCPVWNYSFEDLIENGLEGMPDDVRDIIDQNGGLDLIIFALAEMFASPEDLEKLMSRFASLLKKGGQIAMITSDYRLSTKAGFSQLNQGDKKLYIAWLPLPIPRKKSVKKYPNHPSRWWINHYHSVPTVSYPKHRSTFADLADEFGMSAKIVDVKPDWGYFISWLRNWTIFSKVFQTMFFVFGIPYLVIVVTKQK